MRYQGRTLIASVRALASLATTLALGLLVGAVLVLGHGATSRDADAALGGAPVATMAEPTTSIFPIESLGSTQVGLDTTPVDNALEAAQALWREAYGITCFVQSDALIYRPPGTLERIDAEIDKAHVGVESWLWTDQIWLGTMERAAKAFGAVRLYVDSRQVWMQVLREDRPMLVELVAIQTPAGRTVWTTHNTVTPCD